MWTTAIGIGCIVIFVGALLCRKKPTPGEIVTGDTVIDGVKKNP